MDDVIALGGDIELRGFSAAEPATMIVVKKIIGTFARQLSQKTPGCKIQVALQREDGNNKLTGIITGGKSATATAEGKNLFFALNDLLQRLESPLEQK